MSRTLTDAERVVTDEHVAAKRVASTADPDVWAIVVDPGGRIFLTVHVRTGDETRIAGTSEVIYSERGPLADWLTAMRMAERLVAEQVDMRRERTVTP